MRETGAAGEQIELADSPSIEGLRFRHYRGRDDHTAIANLTAATRATFGMIDVTTPQAVDVEYAHLTNCDLTRDVIVAELNNEVIGFGRVWWVDRIDGIRSIETVCAIDPSFLGRGVGTAMFGWQHRRVVELAAEQRTSRPLAAIAYVFERDSGGRALIEGAGYRVVRRSSWLVRPHLEDIPFVPLPREFEIRRIGPDDKMVIRLVWDAAMEAFAEHWGRAAAAPTDDQFAQFMESKPDPRLWEVAFRGEAVAGQILNYLDTAQPDGSRTGWTESIAVGSAFRRHGLARALLARSLRTVRDAGATRAALGVDADSSNKAIELYKSLGFRVIADRLEYHRPLTVDGDKVHLP